MSALFVIWSYEHNSWWGPGHCGYVESLDLAGRYDARAAGDIVTQSVLLEEIAVLDVIALKQGPPSWHPYSGRTRERQPLPIDGQLAEYDDLRGAQ